MSPPMPRHRSPTRRGSTGGGDTNPANNTVDDVTTITPGADLTITKTHTGNFIQGQTGATYTLTVSNQARRPDQRHRPGK